MQTPERVKTVADAFDTMRGRPACECSYVQILSKVRVQSSLFSQLVWIRCMEVGGSAVMTSPLMHQLLPSSLCAIQAAQLQSNYSDKVCVCACVCA